MNELKRLFWVDVDYDNAQNLKKKTGSQGNCSWFSRNDDGSSVDEFLVAKQLSNDEYELGKQTVKNKLKDITHTLSISFYAAMH